MSQRSCLGSSAVCTRKPPTASMLERFCLPAWSSVHAWLPRLQSVSDFAPERLPAPDPSFARVRPCAQGRCGRCPPGSGVMSNLFFFCLVMRSRRYVEYAAMRMILILASDAGPADKTQVNDHVGQPFTTTGGMCTRSAKRKLMKDVLA